MTAKPLIIERTLNAPLERVWKAITDRDEMEQWYFNLSDFKPEVGFEVEFEAGDETRSYLHRWKVLEVVPNQLIKYSWQYPNYPGYSEVTIEIAPYGEEATRIKLTHDGLETFPELADFARTSFEGGWEYIIGKSLIEYLARA